MQKTIRLAKHTFCSILQPRGSLKDASSSQQFASSSPAAVNSQYSAGKSRTRLSTFNVTNTRICGHGKVGKREHCDQPEAQGRGWMILLACVHAAWRTEPREREKGDARAVGWSRRRNQRATSHDAPALSASRRTLARTTGVLCVPSSASSAARLPLAPARLRAAQEKRSRACMGGCRGQARECVYVSVAPQKESNTKLNQEKKNSSGLFTSSNKPCRVPALCPRHR